MIVTTSMWCAENGDMQQEEWAVCAVRGAGSTRELASDQPLADPTAGVAVRLSGGKDGSMSITPTGGEGFYMLQFLGGVF